MSNAQEIKKEEKLEIINRNLEVIDRGGKKVYKCLICKLNFTLRTSARRHISCVHLQLEKFPCTSCKAVFTRKDRLGLHVSRIHSVTKPIKNFVKHTQAKETSEIRKLPMRKAKCKIKNKSDSEEGRVGQNDNFDEPNKNTKMIYRRRNTQGKIMEKWKCLKCTKTFTRKDRSRAHYMNKHLNKRFPCSKCSYPFTRKSTLQNHIPKCKGPMKKLEISKNLTGDELRKKSKRHLVTIQEISFDLSELPEKIECLLCHRIFRRERYALAHVMKQHFVYGST